MIELYIRKDDSIEGELLKLLGNGYQVLFDNDGEYSDYYWIKLAHPKWTDTFFAHIGENETVIELDDNKYESFEEALREIHGYDTDEELDWHLYGENPPFSEEQVEKINQNIKALNDAKDLYEFIELEHDSPNLDEEVMVLIEDVAEVRDACQDVLDTVRKFEEPTYTLSEAKAILKDYK